MNSADIPVEPAFQMAAQRPVARWHSSWPSASTTLLLRSEKYTTVGSTGARYVWNRCWLVQSGCAGSPNRSTGWHKFTIERLADETTINFYVDDILSRTFANATAQSWDTLILGPGLGTTVGNAWIDGMAVDNGVAVPEPTSLMIIGTACMGLLVARRRTT